MIQRFLFGILLLTLSGRAVFSLHAAEASPPAAIPSQDKTAQVPQIAPGLLDGQVALFTAKLLEQLHFLHKPFDESVSRKFFDRYLEALDPQHMHFIQADLAEFDHYRTNLYLLT
jgi:carboxyl-terminal processing protease